MGVSAPIVRVIAVVDLQGALSFWKELSITTTKRRAAVFIGARIKQFVRVRQIALAVGVTQANTDNSGARQNLADAKVDRGRVNVFTVDKYGDVAVYGFNPVVRSACRSRLTNSIYGALVVLSP